MTDEKLRTDLATAGKRICELTGRVAELEGIVKAAQAYIAWVEDHTSTAMGGSAAWWRLKERVRALSAPAHEGEAP